MADRDGGVDLQPDKAAAWVVLAADQRVTANEIIGFGFQGHRETDAGLERIGLVGKVIAGKDQPGLDAHHVQRGQAHRQQTKLGPRRRHRVINRLGILGMTENLIPQLAGIAGARHHQRRTTRPAQPRHGKAEPAQFRHRRLHGCGPDDPLQNLAAVRPLHRDVVQLVGRGPHQHLQPQLFHLIAQPDPAVIIAADPAEIVLPQPVQRAVVDHPAMLIAHRRIDHLPHSQFLDVPRQAILQQGLAVRPGYFPLPQRRQVDHHGLFAAGPVFGKHPLAVSLRQPIALIFHHVARQSGCAGMKGGLFAHLGLRVRGRAPCDSAREFFGGTISADMNVGRVPAVARRGIIRAGG